MATPRKDIINYIAEGILPEENISQALLHTNVRPSGARWQAFISSICLWVGSLALAVSVVFFVAFNWVELGRFAKFGLIQVLIVCSVLYYCKSADHKVVGKASLLVSTILLGALMALYGQTYQTGADPWQLFFYWAVLMLPWAAVGRFAAIWILWLALINLSIVLHHQVFLGGVGILFNAEETILWKIFVFNTAALIVWQYCATLFVWLQERWAARLVALASGTAVTWLCLYGIFDGDATPFAWLVWIGWGGAGYYFYRKVKLDLFMLAGGCLSGIVVIVAFLSKYVIDDAGDGGFLLVALVVMGLGSGSAVWLKKIDKELQL